MTTYLRRGRSKNINIEFSKHILYIHIPKAIVNTFFLLDLLFVLALRLLLILWNLQECTINKPPSVALSFVMQTFMWASQHPLT